MKPTVVRRELACHARRKLIAGFVERFWVMGKSLRMAVTASLLATAAISGCGPCRCLDGTRFAKDIPCNECFTQCTKIGSAPSQCPSTLQSSEVLLPTPDPKFTLAE